MGFDLRSPACFCICRFFWRRQVRIVALFLLLCPCSHLFEGSAEQPDGASDGVLDPTDVAHIDSCFANGAGITHDTKAQKATPVVVPAKSSFWPQQFPFLGLFQLCRPAGCHHRPLQPRSCAHVFFWVSDVS